MTKGKIKLQLIDEYIKIVRLKVWLEVHTKTQENRDKEAIVLQLKSKYEKIFLKFGMMNDAFNSLTDDLKTAGEGVKSHFIHQENLNQMFDEIKQISYDLPNKLCRLAINQIEKDYILANY